MGVFFLFLLATSLGCLSTLYWIPEEDMGRGYFQMNALVVLGLLGLAAAVVVLAPFQPSSAASSTTARSGPSAGASAAGPSPCRSPAAPRPSSSPDRTWWPA